MLTLIARCESVADPYGEMELPYDLRIRSRLRAALKSGEEVALKTERGMTLRGGDYLKTEDGRVVRVLAAPEAVLHVVCADQHEIVRAAYHLGNRHVAVEIGQGYLRILADHVLRDMLLGLGAKITQLEAPFEPESGAYGGGHSHDDEGGHGGKIHRYETR